MFWKTEIRRVKDKRSLEEIKVFTNGVRKICLYKKYTLNVFFRSSFSFAMNFIFVISFWVISCWLTVVRGQLFQQEIYDYCDPSLKLCEVYTDHTMCKYPVPGLSSTCTPAIHEPLSPTEKKRILFWHNKFRSNVANGSEKNKNRKLPTSSNMRQIYWDKELEALAIRWAEQCADSTSSYPYDKCRNTKRFQVSQNVGIRKINATTIDKQAPQIVVSWYKESKDFDPALVDKFVSVGDDKTSARQFSNIIWADTYALGCARVIFQEQQPLANKTSKEAAVWTIERLVCNYGPGGNQVGKPIYKRGTSCDSCPAGTQCSLVFPGLCDIQSKTSGLSSAEEERRDGKENDSVADEEKMDGQQNLESQDSRENGTTGSELMTPEAEAGSEGPVAVLKGMARQPEEASAVEETEVGECEGGNCSRSGEDLNDVKYPSVTGGKHIVKSGVYVRGKCHCSDIQRSGARAGHSRGPLAAIAGLVCGWQLTNFLWYF